MTEADRIEAIDHIVSSTKYWSSENMKYDYVLEKNEAFYEAVTHVKRYHYPSLTEDDIAEAKRRLKL